MIELWVTLYIGAYFSNTYSMFVSVSKCNIRYLLYFTFLSLYQWLCYKNRLINVVLRGWWGVSLLLLLNNVQMWFLSGSGQRKCQSCQICYCSYCTGLYILNNFQQSVENLIVTSFVHTRLILSLLMIPPSMSRHHSYTWLIRCHTLNSLLLLAGREQACGQTLPAVRCCIWHYKHVWSHTVKTLSHSILIILPRW